MDITQLTATIMSPTMELATVNKNFVVALQKKRAIHMSHGGRNTSDLGCRSGSGSRSGARYGAGNGSPTPTGMVGVLELDPPTHYCWTCGPGCRHNSAKFLKPVAGNIYTSTKRYMQGGAEIPQ